MRLQAQWVCVARRAPAPTVYFLPLVAERDRVLRAADHGADVGLLKRMHRMRLRALIGVAVSQLPILAPPPRQDQPRACTGTQGVTAAEATSLMGRVTGPAEQPPETPMCQNAR